MRAYLSCIRPATAAIVHVISSTSSCECIRKHPIEIIGRNASPMIPYPDSEEPFGQRRLVHRRNKCDPDWRDITG